MGKPNMPEKKNPNNEDGQMSIFDCMDDKGNVVIPPNVVLLEKSEENEYRINSQL